ncbi:hypothetical protein Tco_0797970 [Tanacetum coccineum]
MKKFETPPDSPPVIVIDSDDQPMRSSTRTVAPTPSSSIIQLPISNNFHIKAWLRLKEMLRTCYGHGLTKGAIIQIFYHGLDDPTQEILDAGGIFLYNTLDEAFKNPRGQSLATKINSEFLILKKELKEMRRDHRNDEGNLASEIHKKDDTQMC